MKEITRAAAATTYTDATTAAAIADATAAAEKQSEVRGL